LEKKLSEKVLTPVNPVLPLAIVGLTDECTFSASELELAVGDQPMISLKYIGLTDEHCWLESRKNALCWNGPTLLALSPV
jgi:hypothetical protein